MPHPGGGPEGVSGVVAELVVDVRVRDARVAGARVVVRVVVVFPWGVPGRSGAEAEARLGGPRSGPPLTYWLDEVVSPNRAPLTASTYSILCRLYIVPGLGAKRLDRLTVRDVQSWLAKVSATCQCCAQGKDERRPESLRRCCAIGQCCRAYPSSRTVRDLRTVLRSALGHAITEELITRNVAALVKVPSVRTRAVQAWTSEEARQFLESARTDDDNLSAAFVLVLVLGLRKGEVLGLDWDAVHLDRGEINISWQLQRVRRELLRRETKTRASDAVLPLPEICVGALRHRAAQQQVQRQDVADAWVGSPEGKGLVFTGRYGAPVDPRTFNRAFTARCQKAGVRRITVHDARRTCATLLVDLDVHPRVIMQILRHAQFAVTMEIYARASSAATREALKRLGESLDGHDQPESA